MDLSQSMKRIAEEIDGQHSAYDINKSVVIVPLKESRFQSVIVTIEKSEKFNNLEGVVFTSKVCEYSQDLNLKELLEENGRLCYSKFVLDEYYLKVEASTLVYSANDALLKEIVLEVGQVADDWENKLTGLDVN